MSSTVIHEREQDDSDIERYSKRARLDTSANDAGMEVDGPVWDSILPPSHSLLGIPVPVAKEGSALNFLEADVGISEYIGRGEAKVEGIIKQRYVYIVNNWQTFHKYRSRFTDFLVFEIDQDGNVIHLKTLSKPESTKREKAEETPAKTPEQDAGVASAETAVPVAVNEDDVPAKTDELSLQAEKQQPETEQKFSTKEEPWPEYFNSSLTAFLDEEKIQQLKTIYLEGPEPPRVSDNGWGGRVPGSAATGDASEPAEPTPEPEEKNGRDNRRGRGGKRGGRGGGRGGHTGGREDTRKIVSNVAIVSSSSEATTDTFHSTSPWPQKILEPRSTRSFANFSMENLTRRLT